MPDKIDQINKLIKSLPLPKKGLYKLKNGTDISDYNVLLQNNSKNKTYTINASELSSGGSTSQTLAETLVNGNTTDGENINLSEGDAIILDNGSMLKKGTIDAGLGGSNGIAQICAVGYELKWEAGRLYVMGSNGNTIRQSLYNFTTTPTVNDDSLKGYGVGSLWSMDDMVTYVCTDATEGAAVWELFNTGGNNMILSDDELFFNQKFITSADLDIEENYTIVSKYAYSDYPANPNGSDYNTAMLCDKTGRHLVMMPHIERSTFQWNWANYPKDRNDEVSPWHEAFVNARKWIEKR